MWKYILAEDGVTPVPEPDLLKWAEWYGKSSSKRRLALDEMGGYRISTVFLGMDHSYPPFLKPDEDSSPVLWETIVFFPSGVRELISEPMWRYHTREEALAAHAKIRDRLSDLLRQDTSPLDVAEELNKLKF